MNQAEFHFDSAPASQAGRILAYMRARKGQWIPMVELGALVGAWAVHSRIADCRRTIKAEEASERIRNRTTRKDGKCHSFYILENEQPF